VKGAATKTREVALLDALGRSSGERIIHSYLKKHPDLLWGAFMNCGGHSDYVIPEFRIGSRFRCDFVVMQSVLRRLEHRIRRTRNGQRFAVQ